MSGTAPWLPLRRAAAGRADLLRLLVHCGEATACRVADALGFDLVDEPSAGEEQEDAVEREAPVSRIDAPRGDAARPEPLQARFYGLIARSEHPPRPEAADHDDPLSNDGPVFDERLLRRRDVAEPVPAALVPARRMARLVRESLRPLHPTRQIDLRRWLADIVRARLPSRLPWLQCAAWSESAGLVIVASDDLRPFDHDSRVLAEQVLAWSGSRAPVLRQAADGRWAALRPQRGRGFNPWRPASEAEARRLDHRLVVCSSRPVQGATQRPTAVPATRLPPPWQTSGHATLLLPAGEALPGIAMPARARAVAWDVGARLSPSRRARGAGRPSAPTGRKLADSAVDRRAH